jgi:hypothetical protein
MRSFEKPSIFATFLFAANALVTGLGAAFADEPAVPQQALQEMPPTATYKAHSIVCSSDHTQFVTFMRQQIKPLDPEKVPQKIYRDIMSIFRRSATEINEFIKSITASPMTDDALRKAITDKYNEVQIENRNEINNYFLENWPQPYSFTAREIGRIDIQVESKSHACADI